jgi:amino acid adenylation domain-containing protein
MQANWLDPRRQALLAERRRGAGVSGAARIARRGDPSLPSPLSPGQQRLWFLDQLMPGNPAYHIAGAVWLHGPVDVAAYERAVSTIVARHEVFRTAIVAGPDGIPAQLIGPPAAQRVPVIDVPPGTGAVAAAERLIREPFDLTAGQPLRCALLRVDPRTHLLAVAVHHIAADHWTMEILIGELVALVSGGRPLADLPIQYADFARWQRQWLDTPQADTQLGYWREQLTDVGPAELITDFHRPANPTLAGETIEFSLPREAAARVTELAARARTTPFVVALSVFATVLARWSGQPDLIVGVPFAGRGRAETAPLAGFLVNTVPIRVSLAGSPAFGELVERVRDTVLAAQAHADIPFDHVVDALRTRHRGAQVPLVRHLCQLEEATPPIPLGAAARPPVRLDTGTAKFDLSLALVRGADGGLDGQLEYSTELFRRPTAERIVDALRCVLRRLDAAVPVAALAIQSDVARSAVLGQSGDPCGDPCRGQAGRAGSPSTLHGCIEAQCERTPEAAAVESGGRTLSYAELDARANRLARLLLRHGAGPDRIVGVALPRSLDLMVALLAVLKSGSGYLPLDLDYPPARLAAMVADSGARIVITDTSQGRPWLAGTDARTVCPTRDAAAIAAAPATRPGVEVRSSNAAYMIYTSGSTGTPKGVINEHGPVLNRLWWMQDTFGLAAGAGVLQKTPIGFDVSVWEFFWPLMTGARVVLARPGGHADPEYLAAVLDEADIDIVHFVPSMLDAFVRSGTPMPARAPRRIVCSGEELPAALADATRRALPGRGLFNLYGPTEAAVDVTWHTCAPEDTAGVPIGRPITGARVYLLDPLGEPVPAGVPGELVIGGVPVARGYHGRPGLTASRFVPDPYAGPGARAYRTGDLACWRADGEVSYLGRIDNQVKIRGMRVELGEVEAALAAHPVVESAVVTAAPGPGGHLALTGYVRAAGGEVPEGNELQAAALREFLRSRLPAHLIPSAYLVVAEWPVGPNGKLDRRLLPPPPQAQPAAQVYTAPASELESSVAAIWQDVLGLPRVGVTDDFFDLGGHSLLAIQIIARVHAKTGVNVPVASLFGSPTVRATAAEVGRRQARASQGGASLRRLDRGRYAVSRTGPPEKRDP